MFVYKYPNNRLHCSAVELAEHELGDLELILETDEHINSNTHVYEDGKIKSLSLPLSMLRQYGAIGEQLDRLWHDIDQGLLGESAKSGEFYQSILAVKSNFPKTDK